MPSKQEKFADLKTFPNCFDLFFKDLSVSFEKKNAKIGV